MFGTNQVLQTALAGVLLLPVISLSGDRATNLERSLEETVVALESLSGLRTTLTADAENAPPGESIQQAVAVTEIPIPDARQRDSLLSTLRDDVSRLQMHLDGLRAHKRQIAQRIADAEGHPMSTPDAASAIHEQHDLPPTTGLDPQTRRDLSTTAHPAPPIAIASAKSAVEVEGYSAHRVRQGHAYYRGGRYTEALAALEQAGDGAEATYWRGRALERLGRLDEALAAYAAVQAMPDAGQFADRAQNDTDFLVWRRDFAERTKRGTGENE